MKKRQMRWTQRGAHLLLQTRMQVLNDDLRKTFGRRHPGMKSETATEPLNNHRLWTVVGFGTEWKTEDDPKSKLEEKINSILRRIHSSVKAGIDRSAELAEERRLEKIAAKRREQERQASVERQRRLEVERQRQADLVVEVENWKRAAVVREYVNAIRTRVADTPLANECSAALDAWITWAEHVAESMDPLPSRVASRELERR